MSNHDQTPDEWEDSYTDGALESWELQVSPWPNCLGLIERCQHITVMCPWAERCQRLSGRRRAHEARNTCPIHDFELPCPSCAIVALEAGAQHLTPDPDDGPFEDIDDDEIIAIFTDSAEGLEFAGHDPLFEVVREDGGIYLIVEDRYYDVDDRESRRVFFVAGAVPGVGGSGIDFEEV